MNKTIIKDCKLVNEGKVQITNVLIEDGIIQEIGDLPATDDAIVIDAAVSKCVASSNKNPFQFFLSE